MYTYSIIIPHKNIPGLLERCLDSIPVREDIQIIIIDDNSDPEVVDFSKFPGLERQNTEVYFTKEGKGAGYARNEGLKKAKGKWLLFADADDFYNSGFLKETDKYKETDNDIIYFLANSIDSNTLKPAERHLYLIKTREKYNKKARYNEKEAKNELVYKNWEAWAKMFRKDFIEKNNLFFEETKIGEDALFAIRAGELSDKYTVDDFPLYCITYRADSLCFTIDDEYDFDERFEAKIRINRYLINAGKHKFRSDLDEDILMAYNYGGIQKMREAIDTARKNANKIHLKTYIKYIRLYLNSLHVAST
jgi:glycosyltransferase involved in cell wall biosynthesis